MQAGEIKAIGKHIYGNLYGCERNKLEDIVFLKNLVIKAIEIAKAKLVSVETYSFEGYCAAIGVILESHVSIHAWPSLEYATVDVFTCGNTNPEAAFNFIIEMLKPKKYVKNYVDRSNEL
ncbi:MAG: adenosylmethionine decarboxylase [Candidatus Methanomethylicia archaeon]|nr:adenosylmethionine decarboxylase [Candidatus Methanomethylicia archaeon]MDW7988575.1 adenosylmethionine decarboxylase [Nitrososphaerota archaeon]